MSNSAPIFIVKPGNITAMIYNEEESGDHSFISQNENRRVLECEVCPYPVDGDFGGGFDCSKSDCSGIAKFTDKNVKSGLSRPSTTTDIDNSDPAGEEDIPSNRTDTDSFVDSVLHSEYNFAADIRAREIADKDGSDE